MEERVLCPLCDRDNGNEPVSSYSREPWAIKECRACGMVYLENPPASEALEDELAWEKTFEDESNERRKRSLFFYKAGRAPKAALQRITRRNKLLDVVKRNVKPGPILDVGCAGGHTLAGFPQTYIPFGIEISHKLSEVAAAAFGPRGGAVIQADALKGLAQLSPDQFNGIIMTSFLEHDTKAKDTLVAVRRVMRQDARLILKVPNYASWNRRLRGARWCGFRFPDHVNYFTPDTLIRLLSKAGLGIVRFGILDRLPTSDNMWLIARKANQG